MNREIYEEQYQPEEPLKSDTPEHDPQGSVLDPPSAPEAGPDAHEDVSSPERENEDNSPAKDNAGGENGADAHAHVDVRRAVQRIEEDDVVPVGFVFGHEEGFGHFFGTDGADRARTLHSVNERIVGEGVKLLHLFALHIDGTGRAQNIHQTSLVDVSGNNLGRKNKVVHQRGELSRRVRRPSALRCYKVFNCSDFRHIQAPWCRLRGIAWDVGSAKAAELLLLDTTYTINMDECAIWINM